MYIANKVKEDVYGVVRAKNSNTVPPPSPPSEANPEGRGNSHPFHNPFSTLILKVELLDTNPL